MTTDAFLLRSFSNCAFASIARSRELLDVSDPAREPVNDILIEEPYLCVKVSHVEDTGDIGFPEEPAVDTLSSWQFLLCEKVFDADSSESVERRREMTSETPSYSSEGEHLPARLLYEPWLLSKSSSSSDSSGIAVLQGSALNEFVDMFTAEFVVHLACQLSLSLDPLVDVDGLLTSGALRDGLSILLIGLPLVNGLRLPFNGLLLPKTTGLRLPLVTIG
jgi:hypothetical protein